MSQAQQLDNIGWVLDFLLILFLPSPNESKLNLELN